MVEKTALKHTDHAAASPLNGKRKYTPPRVTRLEPYKATRTATPKTPKENATWGPLS